MIDWLKKKLFGEAPQVEIEVIDPEREAEVANMRGKQVALQHALGISTLDDVQAWLRLHELLHDHEERLKALEKPKTRARGAKA